MAVRCASAAVAKTRLLVDIRVRQVEARPNSGGRGPAILATSRENTESTRRKAKYGRLGARLGRSSVGCWQLAQSAAHPLMSLSSTFSAKTAGTGTGTGTGVTPIVKGESRSRAPPPSPTQRSHFERSAAETNSSPHTVP